MAPERSFPAIRACIFDMDGLLINSEDVITQCTNQLLTKYGRPVFTRYMRAVTMGVPDSTNSDTFHDWAKLPISREQFKRELKELMTLKFPDCEPLPGAEKLLSDLSRGVSAGAKVKLALASSTKTSTYNLKISKPRNQVLLDFFEPDRKILGDDTRLQQSRGKPAPDIYLIALRALNSRIKPGEEPIVPEECLVFEDSIAGVEAGRQADMRIIWVPHPDLTAEYQLIEKEILAGRTGRFTFGDDPKLGEIDDGWAESIPSLERFDFKKYGIQVPSYS